MGADGGIKIWRDDVVRAQFPDCDILFGCIITHYLHELDGVKYHHCFSGDSPSLYWDDECDWYIDESRVKKKRLQEFVDWLRNNGVWWEIWT